MLLPPIVDMEYLIQQMFLWFQVTRKRLCAENEILTPNQQKRKGKRG